MATGPKNNVLTGAMVFRPHDSSSKLLRDLLFSVAELLRLRGTVRVTFGPLYLTTFFERRDQCYASSQVWRF
jgi:hypothetical protein